jgi:hypothetical protein
MTRFRELHGVTMRDDGGVARAKSGTMMTHRRRSADKTKRPGRNAPPAAVEILESGYLR